jgi:hypothetical protein
MLNILNKKKEIYKWDIAWVAPSTFALHIYCDSKLKYGNNIKIQLFNPYSLSKL